MRLILFYKWKGIYSETHASACFNGGPCLCISFMLLHAKSYLILYTETQLSMIQSCYFHFLAISASTPSGIQNRLLISRFWISSSAISGCGCKSSHLFIPTDTMPYFPSTRSCSGYQVIDFRVTPQLKTVFAIKHAMRDRKGAQIDRNYMCNVSKQRLTGFRISPQRRYLRK
jgi:hypothetical protein